MKREKRIEINAAIFPYIMRIALSKPLTKDSDAEAVDTPSSSPEIPDIMIDLPRGAYLLYLKNLAKEHNTLELRLLENYAYGVAFSDNDYEELLKLIMVPVDRNWSKNIQGDLLTPFGVKITTDSNGKQKFALLEDAIPTIKVETWECIIIDHLKQAAEIKNAKHHQISDVKNPVKIQKPAIVKQRDNNHNDYAQYDSDGLFFLVCTVCTSDQKHTNDADGNQKNDQPEIIIFQLILS